MILGFETMLRKNAKTLTRTIAHATCDECSKDFIIDRYVKQRVSEEHHFCSRACVKQSHKHGILRDKCKETNVKKYGVDHHTKTLCYNEKQKQRCQEKYGYDNLLQVPQIKEKIRCTNMQRYGVKCVLKLSAIKEKIKRTNIKRYGVENPMQSKSVQNKAKKTLLKNYGVTCALLTPRAILSRKNPDNVRKAHETMKRNGTFKTSKPEEQLHKILIEKFGEQDVIRQVVVNKKWAIDFYVKSIDTYVQFDGDYWHGLDRPISVIKEFKTKRDRQIYYKWCVDRKQDVWFKTNMMKLIRISHSDLKTRCSADLLTQIHKEIKS